MKANRKTATGLLLVHWSRFSHINIKLEGSSLITGVNGTGKSTILDAITYLLTGNTQFNIAAKDRDRNIAAYVRGDTKSLIHFIESFIKLPSKGVMTRSVLEHDDKQRKSAADQMVRSENKIFCRKENQAILGAVGYRALYTFPNRYKRKRREESQSRKARYTQFNIYPFRL